MSGKGSRERRKEAVRRARADVYASNGDVCTTQPFTCERQARIYEAAYNQWRAHYWRMERLHDELAEVYGYSPHMRSNFVVDAESPDMAARPADEKVATRE